jgi:hypothetical protein
MYVSLTFPDQQLPLTCS